MDRLYRRNLFTQQISFKYNYLLSDSTTTRLVALRLLVWFMIDIAVGVVIIDVIIGYYFGANLVQLLNEWITIYITTLIQWTHASLDWVCNVPIGLKLNDQLLKFLSTKCSDLLEVWADFYELFTEFLLCDIVEWLLLTRFTGVTIMLSLSHDFLKFLNLCLICFYIFAYRLFTLQTSALVSFWRLFRGQKFNPLRTRVDSCNYDTNQLLLGTLLLTILLFLYPTTLVFYAVFFSLRSVQFSVQILTRFLVVLLNKITLKTLHLILSFQSKPDISCAVFNVAEKESSLYVTCFYANKEWNLSELEEFLKSISKEANTDSNKDNFIYNNCHSLLTWFDVSCF